MVYQRHSILAPALALRNCNLKQYSLFKANLDMLQLSYRFKFSNIIPLAV